MGFYGLLALQGVFLAAPGEVPPPSAIAADWMHVDASGSRIIRAPGRIVVGPQNLAADFPYGGVEIGTVRATMLQPLGEPYVVEFEGLGDIGEILEPPHRYVFATFVRGWDDRAIELLFPDHFERGSATQHALVNVPGERSAGTSDLDHAVVLLFVPDDTIHAPSILLHRAIPDWQDGAQLLWQRSEELGLPLSFECMQDASGRIVQIGRLEDIEL